MLQRTIETTVKRRDEKQVKTKAQRIYWAKTVVAARRAFERIRFHWWSRYRAMIRQLERDLPTCWTSLRSRALYSESCEPPAASRADLSMCA